MKHFRPNHKGTIAITANATAQNVSLPTGGGLLARVQNSGPQIAFVEFTSDSSASVDTPTTVGGGFPVFANQPALAVTFRSTDTNVVVVSAGNSTVYITRGEQT